jgi:hypothetical protein
MICVITIVIYLQLCISQNGVFVCAIARVLKKEDRGRVSLRLARETGHWRDAAMLEAPEEMVITDLFWVSVVIAIRLMTRVLLWKY